MRVPCCGSNLVSQNARTQLPLLGVLRCHPAYGDRSGSAAFAAAVFLGLPGESGWVSTVDRPRVGGCPRSALPTSAPQAGYPTWAEHQRCGTSRQTTAPLQVGKVDRPTPREPGTCARVPSLGLQRPKHSFASAKHFAARACISVHVVPQLRDQVSRRTISAMWAGPTSQQPPMMVAPISAHSSANSA